MDHIQKFLESNVFPICSQLSPQPPLNMYRWAQNALFHQNVVAYYFEKFSVIMYLVTCIYKITATQIYCTK